MDRRYFEKKIIKLIPSNTIKDEINKQKHHFTDIELLVIIDRFEKLWNKRIHLFTQAKKVFKDKKILRFIDRYIKSEINYYELLTKICDNEVYEVLIKDKPSSYEERYLCPTYESCFNTITNFFKNYKDFTKASVVSEYTIEKRRIFNRVKPKDIDNFDTIVTACYDYKMNLTRIFTNLKPVKFDGYYFSEICINYPHVFNGGELVSFYNNNNILNYGINCFNDFDGDSCVNYLNCDIISNRLDLPKDYLIEHTHLDFGFLTIVDLDKVDEKVKEDYLFAKKLLEKVNAFRKDDMYE